MKRGVQTFSIFGDIEAAAAEHMIKQSKALRIPVEQFPSRRLHPDIWQNAEGRQAKFALRVPREHVEEFNRTIDNLRA